MPRYKLRRKFFDGRTMHPALSILEFEEGKAPSSAILVDEPEPEVEEAKAPETLSGLEKEPELDLTPKKPTALSELTGKKK